MTVGFCFDQAKCTGCQACILACTIENELAFDTSWRTVYTFNDRHLAGLPVRHLSLSCNHCDQPACLEACPALAYTVDPATGLVKLESENCIGCGYCAWACPFGAPQLDELTHVMSKCTFCADRQAEGRLPACVELCPTGALGVGERLSDQTQGRVEGFPITDIGPAIQVQPAADIRACPEAAGSPTGSSFVPGDVMSEAQANLASEWPLAVFTFLVPVLFGMVAAAVGGRQALSPVAFVVLAGGAAVLSSVHLGKRSRAWRALLNQKTSWLAREILLFGLFVFSGALYAALAPANTVVGGIALAVGISTLFAIDMVYGVLPLVDHRSPHSAGALLTGLLFAGAWLGSPILVGVFVTVKLVLYLRRKTHFAKSGRNARTGLSVLRVVSGFFAPTLVWVVFGADWYVLVLASLLLGEIVDRVEFYLELETVNPESQMAVDLRKELATTLR